MSSPGEALSLSPEQTRVLEENFRVSRHPDPASVMLIAAECGLTEDQTQAGNNSSAALSVLQRPREDKKGKS
ncbi:unnamed protein product [Menidia menidia]|uniref:(Atlantic silverside) hypothetical protein n=1 Tax=Menidia menidia TaxID=238744 RepID=A0A8S4BSN5_9TELE|nr:unnamed protein product [Menidia menidia]